MRKRNGVDAELCGSRGAPMDSSPISEPAARPRGAKGGQGPHCTTHSAPAAPGSQACSSTAEQRDGPSRALPTGMDTQTAQHRTSGGSRITQNGCAGRDREDDEAPTPPRHRQGHQPPHSVPAQAAQGPIQPGTEHLQGWTGHPQPLWAAVQHLPTLIVKNFPSHPTSACPPSTPNRFPSSCCYPPFQSCPPSCL